MKASFKKRALSLLLAFSLAVGMFGWLSFDNHNTHVHAETDNAGETTDNTEAPVCLYGGSEVNQEMFDAFIANAEPNEDGSFTMPVTPPDPIAPIFFYLSGNVSWDGTLVIPDGAFIAVCRHGYEMTGDFRCGETGGAYFFDCGGMHTGCEAMSHYFPDSELSDMPVFSSGFVNMLMDLNAAADTPEPFDGLAYALEEDTYVSSAGLYVTAGNASYVCKNGYDLYVDGMLVSDGYANSSFTVPGGGTVYVLDCANMPDLEHTCGLLNSKTDGYISRDNIDAMRETLATLPPKSDGSPYVLHLATDVSWDYVASAPEGVFVVICLNGHTATGEIDNSKNEKGGMYLVQCVESHDCPLLGENVTTLTQEIVDVMNIFAEQNGYSFGSGHYALAEDITIDSDVWKPTGDLYFCRNGHRLTDKVGLVLEREHEVVYYDCKLASHIDAYKHNCDMFGDTYPLISEDIPYLSALLTPVYEHYETVFSGGGYRYSYVGENGKLMYFAGFNTSDAQAEGRKIFFTEDYGEALHIYVESSTDSETGTSVYNLYFYDTQRIDESSSISVQTYFNIVADGNGDVSLVTVTERPDYPFVIDYNFNTYTATVGENTYFIGASDGEISAVDTDNISTVPKLMPTLRKEHASGNNGTYQFHLMEDITFTETLVVPEGSLLVICTNGHTITGPIEGDYVTVNGEYHICPLSGTPAMHVSVSYLNYMMKMSGGNITLEDTTHIALCDDFVGIDFPFGPAEGQKLIICTLGHTVSDEVFAAMSSFGGTVQLVDCSTENHDCEELGELDASMLNQSLLDSYYQKSDGTLDLNPGTHVFYLTSDITLKKTLKIPAGVDLHLCLNGHTLKSPKIISAGLDGEPPAGYTEDDYCSGAIEVSVGASLTVYDCSSGGTGSIVVDTKDGNGLVMLFSYAVYNYGTFTLKSGKLSGFVGVLNEGTTTVDGGEVFGVLIGIGSGVSEDSTATEAPSLTINGGSVGGALIGVAGVTGEVEINGGEISAMSVAVATGPIDESADPTADYADLEINGGSIDVGDSAKAMESINNSGLDIDINEGSDLTLSDDTQIVGILASGDVNMNEDIDITVHEEYIPEGVTVALKGDIILSGNGELTVPEGTELNNSYTVAPADPAASVSVPSNVSDNIEPADGFYKKTDTETGETTIYPASDTTKLYTYALVLKGNIVLKVYASIGEDFLNDPKAFVRMSYSDKSVDIPVSEFVKSGDYYSFSIAVSAKDYAQQVEVEFGSGSAIWTGATISVDAYFSYVLANDTTELRDLIMHMKSYCMAAAQHFSTGGYIPIDEAEAAITEVSADDLKAYAASASGSMAKGVTLASAALVLESGTSIKIYFDVAEGVDLSELTFSVDGVATTVFATDVKNRYYVEVENISAKDLDRTYAINIAGMTINYSALSYAYTILYYESQYDANLVKIARTLYCYNKEANEYFS